MRQEGEQEEGQKRIHKGVHCVSGLCFEVQVQAQYSPSVAVHFFS